MSLGKDKKMTSKSISESNTHSSIKLPKKDNNITFVIRLLDDTQEPIKIAASKLANGMLLFTRVCDAVGLTIEKDYFGLRYTDKDKQRQWLELDKSAYKQLKESSAFCLSFRVKHYPMDPLADFKQEITKYLLYLQLRRDLVQGRLLCPMRDLQVLGALVLQSEYGDSRDNESASATKSSKNGLQNGGDDVSTVSISSENAEKETVDAFMKRVSIIYHQTARAEEEIQAYHKKLQGLTVKEAESELLNLASKLPTYGVDPFPVIPMTSATKFAIKLPEIGTYDSSLHLGNTSTASDKSSSPSTSKEASKTDTTTLSSPSANAMKQKQESVYIGLTHAGIVTFIGLNRSRVFHWHEIQRIGCDGKRFLIYIFLDERLKKTQLLMFKCEKKASALALWKWCMDRKNFFTLKHGSEFKRTKPVLRIFSRAPTYRFSGLSQMELWDQTMDSDSLPQPEFERISSMRWKSVNRPALHGMASHTNEPGTSAGYSTFPRLRPSGAVDSAARERPGTTTRSDDVDLLVNGESGVLSTESIGSSDAARQSTSAAGRYPTDSAVATISGVCRTSSHYVDADVLPVPSVHNVDEEIHEVKNDLAAALGGAKKSLIGEVSQKQDGVRDSVNQLELTLTENATELNELPITTTIATGVNAAMSNFAGRESRISHQQSQQKGTKDRNTQPLENATSEAAVNDSPSSAKRLSAGLELKEKEQQPRVTPHVLTNSTGGNIGMATASLCTTLSSVMTTYSAPAPYKSTSVLTQRGQQQTTVTYTSGQTGKTAVANGNATQHLNGGKPTTAVDSTSRTRKLFPREMNYLIVGASLLIALILLFEGLPRGRDGLMLPLTGSEPSDTWMQKLFTVIRKQPIVGALDNYCYAHLRNAVVNAYKWITYSN